MTSLLVLNNALQGILSSFFFKFADTILKKYSSTIATIFTGVMSAALFGHALTLNFCLGVSIVFISMHIFFSTGACVFVCGLWGRGGGGALAGGCGLGATSPNMPSLGQDVDHALVGRAAHSALAQA